MIKQLIRKAAEADQAKAQGPNKFPDILELRAFERGAMFGYELGKQNMSKETLIAALKAQDLSDNQIESFLKQFSL